MKRLLLSLVCLVMAFGLYAEGNTRVLSGESIHYLVEKNKQWYEFKSDISLYKESQVLVQTCHQLLGIDEQQTLHGYAEERLNTYDSIMLYSEKKQEQLAREGFVGKDYIFIGPQGEPVGNYQTFEISRSYMRKVLKTEYIQQRTFVYDLTNDKILTVDDIFVPKIATSLKNKAGDDYISLYIQETNVSCGITPAVGTIKFESLNYFQNADNFTEQFKQAIAFDELKAEYDRKETERQQQELRERQRQDSLRMDSLQKVREEYLAKTAYKRITNEFGELGVNQTFSPTLDTTKTSKTNITAGNHVLHTIKNEDGTTDSLWVKESNTPQYGREQRLGVSKRMSYKMTNKTTETRPIGMYYLNYWTTIFDVDIPADNPLFEQRLCKLLMDNSCKRLEDAGEKFVKSFKGKWIESEKANVVIIRGRALSYSPGKYYSYAYSYTYPGLFTKTISGKSPQVDWTISKNIIYDIKNNKVLSLSDVLAIEELAKMGLKKKTKADLAIDNYYLYVGIDGKPVCTYALCRDNWNKFTTVLQDLIGPYENLPTKIDSTAFVFKDYEGIQSASISYKVSQEPSYRGHADSLLVYLKSHLTLPDTMKSEQSWKVQFVVEKDGHLSHVETKADKKGDGDEAFASKLTEVFEQMPTWQPLELSGLGAQKTLVNYNVKFVPYPTSGDDRIYDMVETNAQFPGGDEALMNWLAEHIKYPAICKLLGVQGRVFVSFVIEKDGSIEEAKAIRSPHPALSEEAERVVKSMPAWIPAMQGGKPIRSRFILPIVFRMGGY